MAASLQERWRRPLGRVAVETALHQPVAGTLPEVATTTGPTLP
jgi:hypothetical protein